jgi:cap1 methyltransferase
MGRKRKNRGTGVDQPQYQPIEDPLMIKSSWFGDEIRWISRRDECRNDSSSLQDSTTNINGSSSAEKVTANPSDIINISGGGGVGNNGNNAIGIEDTHQSLVEELNQLKQQLMPAAQSCADAVNNYSNINRTSSSTTITNNKNKQATTPQYEFRQARSICNPYERLGDALIRPHRYSTNSQRHRRNDTSSSSFQFVNRSAIKLANIDALLGFGLTQSSSRTTTTTSLAASSSSVTNVDEYFAFVDVCGAPGGFSEYILYRHMHPFSSSEQKKKSIDTKSTSAYDGGGGGGGCTEEDCAGAKIPCYGFGMSLSGRNDEGKGVRWDLNHLKKHYRLQVDGKLAANPNAATQTFTTNMSCKNNKELLHYHVCNGIDGTGSIYNWENVVELQRQISIHLRQKNDDGHTKNSNESESTTQHRQVHLVVADGGFDAQRDSDNQEMLAHHIVVSQTAAALTLLREGGIFVVKMFGFHEDPTKRMLRYLYGCFDKIAFVKPTSSRPASAERYVVCCGYDGVESNWDGLAWTQQQMKIASIELQKTVNDCSPLDNLAIKFDLDMLKLNVESCRSIVNYLYQKRDAVGKEEQAQLD